VVVEAPEIRAGLERVKGRITWYAPAAPTKIPTAKPANASRGEVPHARSASTPRKHPRPTQNPNIDPIPSRVVMLIVGALSAT
jgi:hypothetical protein